jgi:HAD superfamily hydrolase (TIGR01509 family)
MKSKTLIFDMDGVLIDCKYIHANSFIKAWNEINKFNHNYINEFYHDKFLDGLNTKAKIINLEEAFNTKIDHQKIFDLKQKYTYELLDTFEYPTRIKSLFLKLKETFSLACASNSIRKTVELCLKKLGIYDLFDSILSNEDVINPKPHPEIYNKTMGILNSNFKDTYIFEDSQFGLQSAYSSKANVIRIYNSNDLNYNFIIQSVNHKMRYSPWLDNESWKLRIVIPMAGEGSRFKQAGYTISKPLIPIQGKPMIQWVLENLQSKDSELQKRIEYHLVVRQEAMDELKGLKDLQSVFLHPIPSLTEGAACTVLTVRDLLLFDHNPLLMANSDQFLEWDFDDFLNVCVNQEYDGTISTFYNPDETDTKWSFAAVDKNGYVTNVAEKEYIGPNATTGLYYWQDGSKFVHYAEQMIQANDRVKNEFYVCPVYNYLIKDCGKIRIFDCKKMWGLGVPDDLNIFLKDYLDE